MKSHSIEKIKKILSSLMEQATNIDHQNSSDKSFSLRRDKAIFSENLFSSNSDKLASYVKEVQVKTEELNHFIQNQQNQFSFARLERIEQQIAAIFNAIKANESQNKASKQRIEALKSKKYRLAAQSVLQSSQSLYQKLAETHEFERRLQEMLTAKEQSLSHSTHKNKDKIANELLILHQRLGRCRQAISKIERQIELSEKR